jgi:hypothetical protein
MEEKATMEGMVESCDKHIMEIADQFGYNCIDEDAADEDEEDDSDEDDDGDEGDAAAPHATAPPLSLR